MIENNSRILSEWEWPVMAALESKRGQVDVHNALVSIIIPCYNQAHFLGEAIQSVLAQTYTNYEIIVVDDGSPDNTAEVVARYSNMRYVRQSNQGLSGARNTGIRQSLGEYLVFLDADDRLMPNALQSGLDCLRIHPESAFVSGHHRYINYDGSLLNEYPPEPIDDDHYLALLKGNYIGMHATVMYRRSIFDRVGGFDTALTSCEDYDLYLRIARRHAICRHARIVAEYRWHTANMSSDSARMLLTALSVLHAQKEYIQHKPHYIAACRSGVRFWRGYFGQNLVKRIQLNFVNRQWSYMAHNLRVLVGYCRGWLLAVSMEAALSSQSVRYAFQGFYHRG
jgi:glycosyltransferase involved in cell wall biosynthesis